MCPGSPGTYPAPTAGGDNQPQEEITIPHLLPRFSVSNDLKYDAERDLKDIEASHIPVHALNKVGEELLWESAPGSSWRLCLSTWSRTRLRQQQSLCSPSQPALPTRGSSYFYCGAAQGAQSCSLQGVGSVCRQVKVHQSWNLLHHS